MTGTNRRDDKCRSGVVELQLIDELRLVDELHLVVGLQLLAVHIY